MKYLNNFKMFESSDHINPESSNNLETIRDILLEYRDDEKCHFEDNEHIIYALFDEEEYFNLVKSTIDSWGFSHAAYLPAKNSDWIKKNFQHDKDVLEDVKWKILVWDNDVESTFKSSVEKAKFKIKDGNSDDDLLCKKEDDPNSWVFTMTNKKWWGNTNFLYICYDLWDEMKNKFGLSHNLMNRLMGKLSVKYLIPGQELKNWVIQPREKRW
jgi:hypothetical protein